MWDGPKFLFEIESLEKISLQATVVPALRKEREERGTHCVAHVSSKGRATRPETLHRGLGRDPSSPVAPRRFKSSRI